MEEVGDPKFMNRHAGVSGGAISQDQAYFLNKNLVAIKRPTDLLDNPLVLTTVLNSLHKPDNNVRAAGLDTLRKVKGVEQRPEFGAGAPGRNPDRVLRTGRQLMHWARPWR